VRFLLILLAAIYLEVTLFSMVSAKIGVMSALVFSILTAAWGILLLRIQGVTTLMRAQQRMAVGDSIAAEMVEGVLLAVAGVMLLLPGFATDTAGFLLMLPVLRQSMAKRFVGKAAAKGSIYTHSAQRPGAHSSDSIDGEFKRLDDDKTEK
jgi:UPF0716 protein FxsA